MVAFFLPYDGLRKEFQTAEGYSDSANNAYMLTCIVAKDSNPVFL